MTVALYLLVLAVVLLLAYHLYREWLFSREMAELLSFMVKVQQGRELPEIEEQAEGKMQVLRSELYKLASLLHQAYRLEKRRNLYLSDLLSDISHQIKTPLAAIQLMTNLLKDDQLSADERQQFTDNIDQQINRMSWLVTTLLTEARLDAGVLQLKEEIVVVRHFLTDIVSGLQPLADDKAISLSLSCPNDLVMTCDRRWTAEALSNIIKNCLEHTADGKVTISVSQTNIATDIVISDTGSGIRQQDLPHIFERFYRGQSSVNDSVGIGLSLADNIIKKQNGRITVTSQEGQGTTFHIRFYSI
ncbi:sensor histidine kinase [Streptococcus hillyeri]|uniref:histidine kinase n=1 Tax=Streptococcus hillyeri TaxID=2282420 RepID=A0A3L9DQN1_9STRE|nr:HAMP domain-containing sensor histidine kinase [Streptococcus hillyeri]RLY03225.1 sensor histidine kinase [Streptococcus hillyeri]